MDNVPPLPPSRRVFLWRALCALLFCSAAGFLATVLGAAVWALHLDLVKPNTHALLATVAAAVVLSIVGMLICVVHPPRYKVTLAGFAFCSALVAFLGIDESHRAAVPEIGIVAAPDSAEHQIYMRLVKGASGSAAPGIRKPDNPRDQLIAKKPGEWRQFTTANRERIRAEWAEDLVGRSWLEALAELPTDARIAHHPSITEPLLDFQTVRTLASHRLAYALLLADEGRPNEAAAHLNTLLRASYSLERIGPSTVDVAIACVLLKNAYPAIDQLLDAGTLSDTSRANLLKTTQNAPSYESIIRHSAWSEVQNVVGLTEATHHWLLRWLRVCHPNRTRNRTIAFHQALQRYALAHEWDKVAAVCRQQDQDTRGIRAIRNSYGNRIIHELSGGPNGILKKLWESESTRLTLLERLEAQPTTSAGQ